MNTYNDLLCRVSQIMIRVALDSAGRTAKTLQRYYGKPDINQCIYKDNPLRGLLSIKENNDTHDLS